MSKRDYYEVLGVERTAGADEIKKAFRKLALENHPDRNPNDKAAEARFKEASEAFSVLSDDEKRSRYDRFGHAGTGAQGFQDVGDVFTTFRDIFGGDLFGDLFGGGRGRARPGAPQRGADIRAATQITLKDAATGVKKDVELTYPAPCTTCSGSGAAPGTKPEACTMCRGSGQVAHARGAFLLQTTCPQCRGEGQTIRTPCADCRGTGEKSSTRVVKVTIPAGIEDGQTLRVPSQGQEGRFGGPQGHLYVAVQVDPDPRFAREGDDLAYELHVSFPDAALGVEVSVPTIDGDEVKVKVPAGTQPGDTLVVERRGMPSLARHGRGDLVTVVHVDVPKKLSSKAKKLLQELREHIKSES